MKEVASVFHVGPQFPDRFWRDDAAECDAGDLRVKAWSGEFDRGSVMLIRYARSSSSFCAKWQTGHRFGTLFLSTLPKDFIVVPFCSPPSAQWGDG